MINIIFRRVFALLFVLIGISIIVFLSMHLTPGDPAEILGGPTATATDIAAIRQKMGLNDSLFVQYVRYFKNLLRGDFGFSFQSQQPVLEAIIIRLPNTIYLATASIVISIIIGIPLGILSAVRHNSWVDHSSMVVALLGVSIPNFWLGIVLIMIFSVNLRWFPVGGMAENFFSWEGIRYVFLPAMTLGTGTSALIARMTRSSMLEVIRKDYIRTARAKGASRQKVVFVHALRNAMIPVITIIGATFGILLAGTIVTEQVFAINGIGRLLIFSIISRDFPMVQGCVIFIATMFVLINLAVDLLYSVIDPRITYS